MEWTVALDPSGRFVRVVMRGAHSVEDHERLVDDLVTRPFWKPGTNLLLDGRDLDMDEVTYADMKASGEVHIPFDDRVGDGKSAILMASERDFGSARQFELLVRHDVKATIRSFMDEDEAVEWLRE